MKQPTGLRIAAFLLIAAAIVSCDKSKPELDKATQELKEVSSQRDNLKMQLELSEGKLAEAQKRISALEAAAQASAAATTAVPPNTKEGAKGKRAKSKRSHRKRH